MARDATLEQAAGTPFQLTAADVTNISFQNQGSSALQVIRHSSSTPVAADFAGSFVYKSGEGEINVAIADLFPGQTGSRVWGLYLGNDGICSVQHA